MKIGDKFSNEDKKAEINFENRKETRNMKNTTALLTVQKLYDICGEVEKGFEWTRIYLDDSMIEKFKDLDVTEENILRMEEEIRRKAMNIYAEYLVMKKGGCFPRAHIAAITLFANGEDTLHIMEEPEKETENFDGIRYFDVNCKKINLYPKTSLFQKCFPNTVNFDGITIIEWGMWNIPATVNQLHISEEEVVKIIDDCNLTLSVETAMELLKAPVYQLPIREDVIRWVRDKASKYIAEQPDSEEGRNNVAFAKKRFRKFGEVFEIMYDEERLFSTVLDYNRLLKDEPEKAIVHSFMKKSLV